MLEFLQGEVVQLEDGFFVLATSGTGWKLLASARCLNELSVGDSRQVPVHLAVAETSLTLFGFCNPEERNLFRRLLSVTGVGPSSALAMLSAIPPHALIQAVMDGDWKTIAMVKGIGRKTAERLILDLRGRMDDMKRTPSGAPQPAADDLVRVLTELGFSSNDARNAAQIAREELGVAASFEDLLRLSLQPHTLPK